MVRSRLTARTAAGIALLGSTLALAACGATRPPGPQPITPAPVATPAPPPVPAAPLKTLAAAQKAPVWRPGDRWLYDVAVGSERGVKAVEVVEVREINNAPFYVLRVGELEHFYTTQLEWAGHARDRKIESRISPPLPWFAWPLEPGRRWTYRGALQDSSGSIQRNDTFLVLGAEVVDVVAGRFDTIKVVHESDRGDRDEYWYAPSVRSYVKWVWQRGTSRTEEQLREHHAGPGT